MLFGLTNAPATSQQILITNRSTSESSQSNRKGRGNRKEDKKRNPHQPIETINRLERSTTWYALTTRKRFIRNSVATRLLVFICFFVI